MIATELVRLRLFVVVSTLIFMCRADHPSPMIVRWWWWQHRSERHSVHFSLVVIVCACVCAREFSEREIFIRFTFTISTQGKVWLWDMPVYRRVMVISANCCWRHTIKAMGATKKLNKIDITFGWHHEAQRDTSKEIPPFYISRLRLWGMSKGRVIIGSIWIFVL